ncbi:DNA-binding protein [Pseudarthrobacter sp. NPDC080039]|uniref:DNA-binding protein n=1 Tax=unclassified Pseudarthrobacter TaxID=2647000 RepID=UPI00344D4FDF
MDEQQTPVLRAAGAAEALAAEGIAVTARAVRERSGVRMTVAADAARAWNEREALAEAVPEPPAAVQVRFAALWREAVVLARGEFAEARAGWHAKLEQAEAERKALAEEIEQVEIERDQARAEVGAVRDQVAVERDRAAAAAASAAEALGELRSRADKSEARAQAVEGERDRLISERDRLLAERDELRDAIRRQKD